MQRAVFFDRDGVLNASVVVNGKPFSPRSLDELYIYDEAIIACKLLAKRNISYFGVTNQPDIARGMTTAYEVGLLCDHVRHELGIVDIYICPHDDGDNCNCRKPRPGLLIQAANYHKINLKGSYMVGDRWRDIDAGQIAGCKTIFIDRGYVEKKPANPDFVTDNTLAAVQWILGDWENDRTT